MKETKENEKNKNFTKLTQKSGISLIVLVITIIVIIILAAAVILTISNNNPVAEANKARYESDRENIQAIFTNAIAKVMTHNHATVSVTAGQINATTKDVKETTGEVAYTVTNAMNSNNSSGKVVFGKGDSTDTTFYTGKQLPIYAAGETKWYVDSEGTISLEVAGVKYGEGVVTSGPSSGGAGSGTGLASIVAADPTTYYGEKVTNYETGNTGIDSQVEWQIFYSDTNNIYLIATDYVHYDLLPKKKVTVDGTETEYALNKGDNDYKAYFTNILPAYNGSEDITDDRIQVLNKSYHEYLVANNKVSENENMKAVAYMLDIHIWDTFAGAKAEYAIGGPTIEMLMESYSQKYKDEGIDYRARAKNESGYEISKDGGINWETYYTGMLSTSDTQYVINASDRKADSMWLASPSADTTNYVMRVSYLGRVDSNRYNNKVLGFRPLVCLSSDVSLKAVTDGYAIE